MPGSFAHLHVHTEYSMLDGAARVDDLFAEAARMGMPALAMTDHGQLFGAVDFYMAGQRHGVKPIIGCLLAGQEIITADGVKNVEDVRVGDMVLTHKGRFRRVLRTMRRPYEGQAYTVSLGGRYGRTLTLTEEHPVLVRTRDGLVDWKKPADIDAGPASKHGGVNCWKSWACLPRLRTEWTEIPSSDFLPADFSSAADGRDHPHLRVEVPGRPRLAVDSPTASRSTTTSATCSGSTPLKAMSVPSVAVSTARWGSRFTVTSRHLAARIIELLGRFGVTAVSYDRPDRHSQEIKAASTPLAHLLIALVGKGRQEQAGSRADPQRTPRRPAGLPGWTARRRRQEPEPRVEPDGPARPQDRLPLARLGRSDAARRHWPLGNHQHRRVAERLPVGQEPAALSLVHPLVSAEPPVFADLGR